MKAVPYSRFGGEHQVQEPTMARKGIPYSRFSGKRQEAGESQDRQDRMAKEAARLEGVELDCSHSLADKGVSAYRGRNWKRGDLGKFLDLVDAGVIPRGSVLIVEQVNRLSRLPWMEQVSLWKEILSRGIVIRTCVPPSRYTKDNMDELAMGCPLVIYMMLAHQQSREKSEWVTDAWAQKKRRAIESGEPRGQHCPTWLTPVTEPHPKDLTRTVTVRYDVDDARAAVVRQVYQWCVRGWGCHRIARELNDSGVPCWFKPRPARPGRQAKPRPPRVPGRWYMHNVLWLLSTRLVIGEWQPMGRDKEGADVPQGAPVAGYYPAIVDESLYLAAQQARRGRLNRGGRRGAGDRDANLFTHLVVDADNGLPFRLEGHQSRVCGEKVMCRYLYTKRRDCGIAYAPFERAALDALAQIRPSDVDGRHQTDALAVRAQALQEERTELGLELEALDLQLRELPRQRWPKRVVARMADLEEEIARKDEELRAVKELASTSGRVEALHEFHTCLKMLDGLREKGDRKGEAAARARIKARVPLFVTGIVVRVEKIHHSQRYVHARVKLRSGRPRYFAVFVGSGTPARPPLPLANVDFGPGEVGGDTGDAEVQPEVLAEGRAG